MRNLTGVDSVQALRPETVAERPCTFTQPMRSTVCEADVDGARLPKGEQLKEFADESGLLI
jgi:hypothetical protein